MGSKRIPAALLIIISLISMVTVVRIGPPQAGPVTTPKPSPTASAPLGPNPGPYGKLYDLWNHNAYFERQHYNANGNQYDEAFPVARPDKGANVVYLYFRNPAPSGVEGTGIGLAVSKDGGYTFGPPDAPTTNPVVKLGGLCSLYNIRAVSPSVVYAPKPGGGSQYYMVFEGAGIEPGWSPTVDLCGVGPLHPTAIVNLGNVFLTTSPDGLTWSPPQIIIGVDLGCNNVGTPFIGYFNNKFYVFYHQACPLEIPGITSIKNSRIFMASGTDPTNLAHQGQVMPLGNTYAWDPAVDTHASIISEYDPGSQTTFYYMVFEGSRDPNGVPHSNWGWGIARTTNIDTGPWQKFEYNPIRQTYDGGLGNDIPSIFQFNNAIRVFQRGIGLSNVLILGTTYSETQGNPGVTVMHPGGDPYLYVFPATSQCQTFHDIGRADSDGISWSANTAQDSANHYMCYGPKTSTLPAGQYAVDWNLRIDSLSCPIFIGCDKVVGLDFRNDTASGQPRFTGVINTNTGLDEQQIYRDAFQSTQAYQSFHNQFTAIANTQYEWETFWSGTSYLRQSNVTLRNLDRSDTVAPTTTMTALPANSPINFQVSWSGTDAQSGIWSYDVQYSDNGGAWTNWPSETATGDISAPFTLSQCSHTYAFQARARDNAGNPGSYSSSVNTTVSCNFTLSANPASLTITSGSEQQTTIIVTSNGFSGSVTLTWSAAGVVCWFAGGASSITLSVPSGGYASTIPACTGGVAGSYAVTFTGTSGSLSSSVNVPVAITDFGISAPTVSFPAASSTTSSVTLTSLQGFAGAVNLSVSSPAGLTVTCPPNANVPSGGTVNVNCTFSSSTAGNYTASVAGSYTPTNEYYNAPINHSVSITVAVSTFNISSGPSSLSITLGSEVQPTITVTSVNGFSGSVTLTSSASAGAVGCWFNGGASSITLSVPSGGSAWTIAACAGWGPAGSYSDTFIGTSGSLSRSVLVPITVQDFSISSPHVQFHVGSSTSNVTLSSLMGFAGNVSLSTWASSGLTVSCPSSVVVPSGGSVTIACIFSSNTAGNYTVTFTGSFTPTNEYYNAKITHSLSIAVAVTDFTVSLGPATQTVGIGSAGTFAVTISQIGGFSGTVYLGFNSTASVGLSAPVGVTCTIGFSSVSMPPSPATATLSCSSSTPGQYSISVTGTSGSLTRSATVTLLVAQYSQFRDTFNYGLTSQMPPIGYLNYGTAILGGGVLTLVNNGTAGAGARWTKVIPGVTSWSVSENAEWVTGNHTYYGTLALVANTTSHLYTWAADGFYNQYIFYRDGQILLRINGYSPQLNAWHNLRIDMIGGTLYLYFDSSLITTYVETGANTSLTQFGPTAGWESADSFNLLTANQLDFSISAGPSIQTISTGSTGTYAVTIRSINGLTGTLTLGASAPSGTSCSVSPTTVSLPPSPRNATLSCSSSTAGTYTASVSATIGTLSHSTSVQLLVGQDFQFQDNFNYGLTSQMPAVGYSVTGSQSLAGGVLTLTNDGTTGAFAHWTKVTAGVSDWTISENAEWVVGSNSYYGTLHLDAVTSSHSYGWHADGFYSQFIFYRDGQILQQINGYTPQLNVWHTLRMDMIGGTLNLYFDGKLITTYTETSTNTSLSQFGPAAGWESSDSFNLLQAAQLDFSISASPTSLSLRSGSSGNVTITVTSINGFYGSVSLSSSASPSTSKGPFLSFTPSCGCISLTSNASTTAVLTISSFSGLSKQNYTITVTATGGGITHTLTITLTIV